MGVAIFEVYEVSQWSMTEGLCRAPFTINSLIRGILRAKLMNVTVEHFIIYSFTDVTFLTFKCSFGNNY